MPYPNANRNLIQTERQRLQRQLEDLNQREMQMQQFEQQQMQMWGPQPAQNRGNGYVWVDGEQAARAWMVNAGEEVFLMDINVPCFYIKKMDQNGRPLPLRIFDYKERTQEPSQAEQQEQEKAPEKYVTREEYEDLAAKYKELLEKVNNFSAPDSVVEAGKQAKSSSARGKGGNADE